MNRIVVERGRVYKQQVVQTIVVMVVGNKELESRFAVTFTRFRERKARRRSLPNDHHLRLRLHSDHTFACHAINTDANLLFSSDESYD